ncbi:unnamed protein product [Wuchereria bancrofti]|uniref:BAG domain-containing protein n=1 Tax=Wuchereria bancrofti TaxID=6293 RepID=A0A3P7FUD5_WUCBA|nr:unnamed protein product [Wuchereria bancrofti]
MEQERESLINMLGNVNLDSELLRLGQAKFFFSHLYAFTKVLSLMQILGDRDDISATASRLLNRCKAVEVVVNTPRNAEQTKALTNVNNLIEAAINKMKEDLNNAKEAMKRFLNACSPDLPDGPIDQRFQTQVIECTADDQKKIRRRLAILINQIERAQRYGAAEF